MYTHLSKFLTKNKNQSYNYNTKFHQNNKIFNQKLSDRMLEKFFQLVFYFKRNFCLGFF